GFDVDEAAVFVEGVFAGKAAFAGEWNKADAVAEGEGAAPVAVFFGLGGDVDDGLAAGGKTATTGRGVEVEVEDELDAGGIVALADEAGGIVAGDFGGPFAGKKLLMRRRGEFGAEVEAAGGGVGLPAGLTRSLLIVEVEAVFAVDRKFE